MSFVTCQGFNLVLKQRQLINPLLIPSSWVGELVAPKE